MNQATRHVARAKIAWKKEKISVIILAAGISNKMKSYGLRQLINVTPAENLIYHQLKIINNNIPINEIILVCGYDADKLMNCTPNNIIKVENEKYEQTNVLRSLAIGLRAATTNNVLIMYGDLIFNNDTLLNISLQESAVILDDYGLFNNEGVGCTFNDNNYAEYFSYDINNKWVQIAFLKDKELDILRSIAWNKNNNNLFTFEALNEIIDRGGKLRCQFPKNMKIIDIDSTKDLQYISQVIR